MKPGLYKMTARTITVLASVVLVVITLLLTNQFDATADKELTPSSPDQAPFNLEAVHNRVGTAENLDYGEMENSVLDIYYPKHVDEPVPVILWIHGGGYVGGSKDSRQNYAMVLADSGFVVANIDYALAPAQLYPGPIIQANDALEYLKKHAAKFGGDMTRIYIGGDSAGAQISSQLAAVMTNEALAAAMNIQPAVEQSHLLGAILHCGLYNMDTVRATGFPSIDFFLNTYTGSEKFEDFSKIDELSTVQHITSDYPPVFLTVGDADPFASQSEEMAVVLETYGVPVERVFFEGSNKNLKHEYQYALHTADAQQTLEKTVNFLQETSRK